jgi:hypothetical protein
MITIFCDFRHFSAKKCVFIKNQCYDPKKLSSILYKNVKFCGENIFKIITSLPGVDVMITIFCNFRHFYAKKLAFLSKTNVMIKILHNLPFLSQKRQFFC